MIQNAFLLRLVNFFGSIAMVLLPLGFTIAGIGYFTVGNIGGGLLGLWLGVPTLLMFALGALLGILS